MEKTGAVLVIGGGISGMQAGLDLAESGFKVYIVEKTPTIGGRMAQLDKTFPTNDCSMCTLAPKMVAVSKHPDIELLVYSEVVLVEGEAGNFEITIKRHPRYVSEEKCNGCGLCAEVCPIKVPNEFDEDIGARKAIYAPFPQTVPLIYTIDRGHCVNCGLCKVVCGVGAIDYEMQESEIKVAVGSIIVSTGYDLFDSSALEEYGFGRYPNVVSNLQFERILSASGPTGGHIIRPSDGAEPQNIAFIQCVGSRDVRHYPYCSQICCMASTKEAILAGEHLPGVKSTIYYMDLRAFGKGFQEYVNRSKDEYGVNYVRARPSQILEDPKTKNLKICYDDTSTGEVKEEVVDLVVLAPALKPSTGSEKLAKMLGITLDRFGYFSEVTEESPFDTIKPGIFITGACTGPKDIPDSVGQASGAAVRAGSLLSGSKGSLTAAREEVPEKELADEPRVGVLVCSCGLNIASIVDVKSVTEYAKTLPGVVYAENIMYTCSDDTQVSINDIIKEKDLNRLVIASCTPRTHEPLFRETCREAGLNPYLFEMANIREHCSWVHSKEPEKATEKAEGLIRMAVARSRLLKPQKIRTFDADKSATVIGGGLAGMTAAVEIAKQGFRVDLIERTEELGGHTNDLNSIFLSAKDPDSVIGPLRDAVENHPNINTHLGATITNLDGFTGNFELTVRENGNSATWKTGAIIVATGSDVLKPEGKYLYGQNRNVMTQFELEKRLKKDFVFEGAVMIQCVGARDETRPSCSRTCCIDAIKNAINLKTLNPEGDVTVLFRDMMTFGKYEEYYRKAQEEYGVNFVRYVPDRPPEVIEEDGKLKVTVYDSSLGSNLEIMADKVILSTPHISPKGIDELQKILKVPRSTDGFFMEAHIKLRPLEFMLDGMFLCGSCQGPKELSGVIAQASGAASKVCSMLSKGIIEAEATTAIVDEELCIACGRCAEVCPLGVISIVEKDTGEYKSSINDALCKGCGTCASVCPNSAITARHFERAQILAMIDELMGAS
ncbi:MAG: CoB--CoM heterodisulfide reductase iron-sulfur subunit A family protein [Candidatus Hydrothermarchaeaceae archaeon]